MEIMATWRRSVIPDWPRRDVFVKWAGLHRLRSLRGLKRVIVGNRYLFDLDLCQEQAVDRARVMAKLQEYAGESSVEFVFDDPAIVEDAS
jgi:hypothetical protein